MFDDVRAGFINSERDIIDIIVPEPIQACGLRNELADVVETFRSAGNSDR
jgi:hypothetical protein